MTFKDRINNEYFEWMYNLVCDGRYCNETSYRKLLMRLHSTEFIFIIPMDENRAVDGVSLRYRFALSQEQEELADYIDGPCSVLEMMVALATRCEESLMDDLEIGERTGQWFWNMITSLGLGSESDTRFDRRYVEDVVEHFLYREYEPDGRGGLFTIKNCRRDLREIEIWLQMNEYLKSIL